MATRVKFQRGEYGKVPLTDKNTLTFVKNVNGMQGVNRVYVGDTAYSQYGNLVEGNTYGFHFNGKESDPTKIIEYVGTNAEYTPVSYNFSTHTMNMGDWSKAFFIPRPCVLNFDGTVKGYLQENDFTKLEDGSAAPTLSTEGNCMMEWPQIWLKIVPDNGDTSSATVHIASYRVDDSYTCYNCYDESGTLKKHFYTPIYMGSIDSSGRLRSVSGQTAAGGITADDQRAAAKKNGTGVGYDIETWVDRQTIIFLLWLIGHSTDTQTVFGAGRGGNQPYSWNLSNMIATGTMNTAGLWYGDTQGITGVKVFGMENWWGNIHRRTIGLGSSNSKQCYKLTPTTIDGSTVTSYNTTNTGYLIGANNPSDGYISKLAWTNKGFTVAQTSGSDSTYLADRAWFASTSVAFFGGTLHYGRLCGASAWRLSRAASYAGWDLGAALSFR